MISPLILLILAGFLSGVQQIISKSLTRSHHSSDSYSTAALLASAFVSFPLLFIQFRLPQHPITWAIIGFSVVAFALSTAFSFGAYKQADVSVVSLLQRIGGVITFILGVVFLHESLTGKNVLGLLCISFGSIVILYHHSTQKSHLKGIIFTFLMALFGSIAAVLDKQVLSDFSPYTYVFVNNLLVGLVFLPRKNNLTQAFDIIRTQPNTILVRSLVANGSFILALLALQQGAVSSIMPIYKTISLMTAVFLGIILFKETTSLPQKIAGLLLSTLGIFLMY